MQRIAFLTGTTGQDGSYLSELLLDKGYKVYGLVRRSSVDTTERVSHLIGCPGFEFVEGDVTDAACLFSLISRIRPREVYNLAAMSHVGTSFYQPAATFEIDATGALHLLEAIRQQSPETRFYQASTSELFGDTAEWPQDETTPFKPNSPYAVAKLAAHRAVGLYRRAYGLFACAGILFNHESPRRGETFVTRKITRHAARLAMAISQGNIRRMNGTWSVPESARLHLGNLDAKRDWGHARDYVRAMWLMLQQAEPDDYVVATGETRSIKEFLAEVFGYLGLPWEPFVVVDPKFYRPADVSLLCGNAQKAQRELGWEPQTSFRELVCEMVEHDCRAEGFRLSPMEGVIGKLVWERDAETRTA